MKENHILEFLTALKENNSMDWMHEHEALKKEATAEFNGFIQCLLDRLISEDPAYGTLKPADLTFRLNRDTRFSHDKSPYTPAFRAHLSPAGKLPIPVGYYIHFSPGYSFIGGGLYASMFTDATTRIRDYILKHGEELVNLVEEPDFKASFQVVGEKLKRVPKGYDPEHPQGEYLKHKSLAVEGFIDDRELLDLEGLEELTMEKFRLVKPFNDYINKALEGFVMPERPR